MSTQRKPDFVEEGLSEQAVREYLEANPDFFDRHGALLSSLSVPHGSGEAISLVERQVSVLRQKEIKLSRQIKDLIDVARANDTLAAKIHELSLQLMAAKQLLADTEDPDEEQIRHAIAGNLCRCTGYTKIVDAIKMAAEKN